MAIREKIAERLLRQGQTVQPAEVLSVNGFKLPTLDTYRPEAIGDFLKNFSSLPSFAYGKVLGPTAGTWYAVKYPKTMPGAVPVAIGLGRLGSIANRVIEKVEDMNVRQILRVTRDDFNSDYYCKIVAEGARDRVQQLTPPWPLDIIWDFVVGNLVYTAFYYGWFFGGWVLNILWDNFLQKQIDHVSDSINSVIGDANAKVNAQLSKIQDAVNLRLTDLYNMWGLPTNTVPTPLHVRNATSSGFEFQSYGNTTAYWFAIGQ